MAYLCWDLAEVAEQLGAALATAAAALDLEQAVKGLDACDERAIHAILGEGLRQRYEVAREVHYPSSSERKLTHRSRCDLVLTPKGRAPDLALEDALWLEVKLAAQLSPFGGRHLGYTQRWHGVMRDVTKMTEAPALRHAALVLVVFTESEGILDQDLETFETLLVRRGIMVGFRHVRTLPIADRVGHRYASVVLWPTPLRGDVGTAALAAGGGSESSVAAPGRARGARG